MKIVRHTRTRLGRLLIYQIKQAVPDDTASENFHSQSCDISDDWIYVAIVPHKLRLCKAFRIAQSGKPFHFVP